MRGESLSLKPVTPPFMPDQKAAGLAPHTQITHTDIQYAGPAQPSLG